MSTTDMDQLLEMGFEKERAELAVKKTGDLQGALTWLENNQEKSLEDIQAEAASTTEEPEASAQAKSYVCSECGKKFRGMSEVQYHVSKSGHSSIEESADALPDLTPEEKKKRLEELRVRLAEKRSMESEQDKLEKKRNDEIRRKSTKETQDAKEELQKKERIKEAQAKRRERTEEAEAKKRIRAKIEADKVERRLRADREKAERENRPIPVVPSSELHMSPTEVAEAGSSNQKADYTEVRLRLRLPPAMGGGNIVKTFTPETKLLEVKQAIEAETSMRVLSFMQGYPKQVFEGGDFGKTLKDLGMVPSASLVVR
ncbi:MAG: hypothetical protein M1834_009161 [Cirrosporium novae-zelandiae]|nr:MAG: hypothetical protein M1834_009161 [Cirrosporium novae-zelandiae]